MNIKVLYKLCIYQHIVYIYISMYLFIYKNSLGQLQLFIAIGMVK